MSDAILNPKDEALRQMHGEEAEDYRSLEHLVSGCPDGTRAPIFTTDLTQPGVAAAGEGSLFDTFLSALPANRRQHYTCRHCREFVERFGGLVIIDFNYGTTIPLIWPLDFQTPAFFRAAIEAVVARVKKARVSGVFLSELPVWGTPKNVPGPGSKYQGQEWTHLACRNPAPYERSLKSAEQLMAEKKQDFGILKHSMAEFSPIEVVRQAVRILEADAVERSEKFLEHAKWLLALKERASKFRGPASDNLIWLAVAEAPAGWCHVRSSMIGTLLQDIKDGLDFKAVQARWNEKVHPLQYQRPTAPPKEGSIDEANKMIDLLGARKSLERRFGLLTDVIGSGILWLRHAPGDVASGESVKDKSGAFDHLKRGSAAPVKELELPAKTMTWVKFQTDVLPKARKIEVRVPAGPMPFYGLVTAVHKDAPPIIMWDGLYGSGGADEDNRNPATWFYVFGGSYAHQWGLTAGTFVNVPMIFKRPCHWQAPDRFAQFSQGAHLVLEGIKPSQGTVLASGGGAFFPEILRSELHGIRSVLEAHARQAVIAGADAEGHASGIGLDEGMELSPGHALILRVLTTDLGTLSYRIDRWD